MPNTFTFSHGQNYGHNPKHSAPNPRLTVILGSYTIKAFVAAPRDVDVMGIVRWGMEFGLLAKTAAGRYLRVNGSRAEPLNQDDVEAAIARASVTGRGAPYAAASEVRVVQRKHRHIDPLRTARGCLQ